MEKLIPIDKNDVVGALTAIYIPLPGSFSARAHKVWDYLEGTAFLFYYKGRYVVTDESLYLTDHGDGSREAPFGGPRYTCDTLDQVEAWLEYVADRYDEEDHGAQKTSAGNSPFLQIGL